MSTISSPGARRLDFSVHAFPESAPCNIVVTAIDPDDVIRLPGSIHPAEALAPGGTRNGSIELRPPNTYLFRVWVSSDAMFAYRIEVTIDGQATYSETRHVPSDRALDGVVLQITV